MGVLEGRERQTSSSPRIEIMLSNRDSKAVRLQQRYKSINLMALLAGAQGNIEPHRQDKFPTKHQLNKSTPFYHVNPIEPFLKDQPPPISFPCSFVQLMYVSSFSTLLSSSFSNCHYHITSHRVTSSILHQTSCQTVDCNPLLFSCRGANIILLYDFGQGTWGHGTQAGPQYPS